MEKRVDKKQNDVTFIVIDVVDAYRRYLCGEEVLMTEGDSLSFRKCTILSFDKSLANNELTKYYIKKENE